MNNAEWMVKSGYDFTKLGIALNGEESFESYSYKIFLDKTHIATITTNDSSCLKAMLLWLNQKHVEPILDDAETRYLSAVIRPFRVVFIRKDYHNGSIGACEQIVIRVESVTSSIADIPLPFFKAGEMYKGMKMYKEYTPEELGL